MTMAHRTQSSPLKRTVILAIVGLSLMLPQFAFAQTRDKGDPYEGIDVSDTKLVGQLKGFKNGEADVNGVRLHYVEGGKGPTVILMPGWPQTWWAFHKIVPRLAENYHVVAVDIRGMGTSDKPAGGYDKKTMAKDIHELVKSMGLTSAHIVGHDIGSQVAYAYAANYPQATTSVTFLDVAALPESAADLKLIPEKPVSGEFRDNFFLWWFAFNQVHELPDELIEGRAFIYQNWFWDSLLFKQDALTKQDRAVYANAYNSRDGVRGGNGWYQAYPKDLADQKTYPERLTMPSLGIGGLGNGLLVDFMSKRLTNPRLEHITESGHYIAEEAPEKVTSYLLDFLNSVKAK